MPEFDVILRSGTIVGEYSSQAQDIGIADGVITAIEPSLPHDARDIIELNGHLVMPGAIDPHVHFNEPGRTDTPCEG